MQIFRHIFLTNYWWQESDIWSQASYRYAILWEAFLNPSDSYFLFADLVDFYTHWTYILYMTIFSRIFLSNYWLQKSDIWSQALYRYPISWESFFDPSDSYFLFTEERGYHKWALAHSSSCWLLEAVATCLLPTTSIIFSLREEYYILHTWRVLYSPYVKYSFMSCVFDLSCTLADVCFSWVVHVLKAEKLGPGLEPTICHTNDVVPLHLRMLPLLKMTIS